MVFFLANLGGTLGVCVGASFLTLCEFAEFGILSLMKRLTAHHKGLAAERQQKIGPV